MEEEEAEGEGGEGAFLRVDCEEDVRAPEEARSALAIRRARPEMARTWRCLARTSAASSSPLKGQRRSRRARSCAMLSAIVLDARCSSVFCKWSSRLVILRRRACIRCPPSGAVVPSEGVYESVEAPSGSAM